MHTRRWIGGALALAVCASGMAMAQNAPVIHHTFEDGDGGWMGFGANAKVSVTHDAANVKEGKAALQFDYSIAKGEMNALMLPTPDGALAKAKALRFWIKLSHAAPVAVALQEQGGGRYITVFTVPKDSWQQVEIATSDLFLSDGKDDPKDPDGKLDLDQVDGVGIMDLSQMFAQADNPQLRDLLNVKLGPQTLYVDDFKVTEEALPSASSAINGDVRIDTFTRPQVAWMGVGDVRLGTVSDKPLEGRALQAAYKSQPGKVIGLMKGFPKGRLAGTNQLAFDAASAKPTRLVVQVEETSGGKYNAMVTLPGNSEVKHIRLAYSEFAASDDSHDDNGHLDIDQVKSVVIIDMSGMFDMVEQDNTLWIGNLRASSAKE